MGKGRAMKYATKWEAITREEYLSIFDCLLKSGRASVHRTYTNPGKRGEPNSQAELLTTYADDKKDLIKSVGKVDRGIQPNAWNWDYEYFKATEWEEE